MTDQEHFADDMAAEGDELQREELAADIKASYDCLRDDEGYPHDMAVESLADSYRVDINVVESYL